MCKSEHVESRGICQVSPATLYLVPLMLALELPFFLARLDTSKPHILVSLFSILELWPCMGPHPTFRGAGL